MGFFVSTSETGRGPTGVRKSGGEIWSFGLTAVQQNEDMDYTIGTLVTTAN